MIFFVIVFGFDMELPKGEIVKAKFVNWQIHGQKKSSVMFRLSVG